MSKMCFGEKDQWQREGDYGTSSTQRAVTQNGLEAADLAIRSLSSPPENLVKTLDCDSNCFSFMFYSELAALRH